MSLPPRLTALEAGNGKVRETASGWSLSIPAGPAGTYRLAQLDNYHALVRRNFPSRPPLSVKLEARVDMIASGTWGFGLWNNPLGLALSPRVRPPVLPCPPQAAWFFWASAASYLSFRDDLPANGMLVQSFCSDLGWQWIPSVALQLATSRKAARTSLSRHIAQASRRVFHKPSSWHAYEIRWTERQVQYSVDDRSVLRTKTSPHSPLGLVVWIDNQFAAFDPANRIAWGFEATPGDCRLEIRNLRISP